jgi:hypothetical protein
MPLTKFQFRPGINREVTNYTNEGGWHDGDKIRFTKGFPEKIGGWVKYSQRSYLGDVSAMHPWRTLIGERLLALGTGQKYYIEEGQGINDVTPLRETTAAGDVTFAATDGSYEITVSDTLHGAAINDFVTFTDAVSLGGNITAGVLNQEYQVVGIVNENSYVIEAREANTSISNITVDGQLDPTYVTANSSDTGNGGSSVVGAYQLNTAPDVVVAGAGWGAGTWSRNSWGSAASVTTVTATLRHWSQDNFGEDLIINPRDGNVYYWDRTASTIGNFQRAVPLSTLSGASDTPTVAKQILVSDRDRHVIAFGCDPITDPGVQDPMLIRFSDQENIANWTPEATNTAGDLRIDSGSEIIAAVETRQQVLVYTDVSLYAMQYLGTPFTFGINLISENITLSGPEALVASDDQVFWMGREEFYVYNGSVQRIPCTVRGYVFDDFNVSQRAKVVAGLNSAHSEVWWFYPSSTSPANNRYVIYNYEENLWYYGDLMRAGWIDRGVYDTPIGAGLDGYLYSHETGFDDGSTTPATPIDSYIQSSPLDIGDGEQFSLIRRVFPDVSFENSSNDSPYVDITLDVRNISGGNYLRSSTASYYDNNREQIDFRLRGRQLSFKLTSHLLGTTWRLGSPRIDIRPDGRR